MADPIKEWSTLKTVYVPDHSSVQIKNTLTLFTFQAYAGFQRNDFLRGCDSCIHYTTTVLEVDRCFTHTHTHTYIYTYTYIHDVSCVGSSSVFG
jgi:hypothetical protein